MSPITIAEDSGELTNDPGQNLATHRRWFMRKDLS